MTGRKRDFAKLAAAFCIILGANAFFHYQIAPHAGFYFSKTIDEMFQMAFGVWFLFAIYIASSTYQKWKENREMREFEETKKIYENVR